MKEQECKTIVRYPRIASVMLVWMAYFEWTPRKAEVWLAGWKQNCAYNSSSQVHREGFNVAKQYVLSNSERMLLAAMWRNVIQTYYTSQEGEER